MAKPRKLDVRTAVYSTNTLALDVLVVEDEIEYDFDEMVQAVKSSRKE